ncbi:hypothetical protein AB0H83_13250 [Dactylosporangium sp. NPDC050688]|uniref:hypothetical protein n=1 Tax=Dactylosporangium sp. NPDC050688 TaxID=3157217 RepID=UPI0033E46575
MLGTPDVCSLFDAATLTAAVPGGTATVSELDRRNDLANYGTCEFSTRPAATVEGAGGDFAELRFEAFDADAAEAHEDAVHLLRNMCALPPLTGAVQGLDDSTEQ